MVLVVARPDSTPLGVLALDGQDAEILAERVHEMSADRYGSLFAEDWSGPFPEVCGAFDISSPEDLDGEGEGIVVGGVDAQLSAVAVAGSA